MMLKLIHILKYVMLLAGISIIPFFALAYIVGMTFGQGMLGNWSFLIVLDAFFAFLSFVVFPLLRLHPLTSFLGISLPWFMMCALSMGSPGALSNILIIVIAILAYMIASFGQRPKSIG